MAYKSRSALWLDDKGHVLLAMLEQAWPQMDYGYRVESGGMKSQDFVGFPDRWAAEAAGRKAWAEQGLALLTVKPDPPEGKVSVAVWEGYGKRRVYLNVDRREVNYYDVQRGWHATPGEKTMAVLFAVGLSLADVEAIARGEQEWPRPTLAPSKTAAPPSEDEQAECTECGREYNWHWRRTSHGRGALVFSPSGNGLEVLAFGGSKPAAGEVEMAPAEERSRA